MFCGPKGQELDTFVCKKSCFLTPLGPLGCVHINLKKIVSDPAVYRSNLMHLHKETL